MHVEVLINIPFLLLPGDIKIITNDYTIDNCSCLMNAFIFDDFYFRHITKLFYKN